MTEPTNREILDALIGFKEAAEDRFNHIDSRLDAHERHIELLRTDMNRRFDRVDQRLDEHDRRFDEHDRRFDEHDRRFGDQDQRFDGLHAEMKAGFDELRREIRGRRKRG